MTISPEEGNAGQPVEEDSRNYIFPENELVRPHLTPIQEFYKDSSIFVTGGTGFMGKVILDKLLRCCSDVKTIYLLVRSKKGKDMYERVDELFEDPIFERMKKEVPKFRHKIIGVAGDCSLPDLGLKPDVRQMLTDNVQIVLHGAATVRFDEKLPLAAAINVRGTIAMLALAAEMTRLKVFVHISTAYSNCNSHEIKEEFFPPGMTGEKLLQLVDSVDEETCEKITPNVIKTWPNTYAFTKCIAEDCVRRFSNGLPIVVFRPAIVIGTRNEPVSGWIDNLYGPTGMVVGVGAGLLRVTYADVKTVSDLVPVDMAVNALLVAAWQRVQTNDIEKIPVYNYVSSVRNPINYGDFLHYNMLYGCQIPSIKAVWCYTLYVTKYMFLYRLYHFLLHLIPAFLIDAGLLISGRKPRALKIYQKIDKFINVLAYFSTQNWHFHDDNVPALWAKTSPEDREIFDFDIASMSWETYFKESLHGVRKYLFKDDPSTLPAAIKRMKKLRFAHNCIKYMFWGIGMWILYKVFTMALGV